MHPILFGAASALALAACGDGGGDETLGDLNAVDNTIPPGNVFEAPTGNGSTVTPTENGLTVEVPVGNGAAGGNAGAGNVTASGATDGNQH